MSLPSEEELKKFRDGLGEDPEAIEEKLCRQIYGMKDTWKVKEAQARVASLKVGAENKIKQSELSLQVEANDTVKHANIIAMRALWISVFALVISVLVFLLK